LTKEQQASLNFKKQKMDPAVFKKVIDGLRDFSQPLKALIFAGHGEPLTHSHIADMVGEARAGAVAERVEIVSNGSLLSGSMSDALIKAGLNRLKISVQGLDEASYRRVSGVTFNFDEFMANLTYFNRNKTQTDFYIKIINIALQESQSEQIFHSLFDHLCDTAAVEYLFPFIDRIDHASFGVELSQLKHGGGLASQVAVCAMPFYMLVILPNGDVTVCCAIQPPVILGNVRRDSLADIWQGEKRRSFLATQIIGRKGQVVCRACTVPDYGMQPGDYLDAHRSRLMELFVSNR
jgi:radical SAM protein with 4Fe4S-binding SPASM domain